MVWYVLTRYGMAKIWYGMAETWFGPGAVQWECDIPYLGILPYWQTYSRLRRKGRADE